MKQILIFLSLGLLLSCTHSQPPVANSELPATPTPQREPTAQGFTETCRSGSARGQSYAWCLNVQSTSRSSTLVYYFHGNGGSEHSWNTPERENLKSLWKQKNLQAPMVVNISFGPGWFLSEKSGFFAPSLHEVLVRNVIPEIESALQGRVKKRIIMGESMGGYNAALLYTKRPEMFNGAAIICPAIYPFIPFISEGELQSFIARNRPHVNEKLLRKWISKLADAFPSAEDYARHDPIQLGRRLTSKAPEAYILADGGDEFGFYEGGEKLNRVVNQAGVKTRWFSIPQATHCGHSAASFDALARFLGE